MKKTSRLVNDIPDWMDPIDREAWLDYLEMRRKKKKPMTPKSTERALEKLWALKSEGQTICLVLNQSTDNCWLGLFKVNRTYLEGFLR